MLNCAPVRPYGWKKASLRRSSRLWTRRKATRRSWGAVLVGTTLYWHQTIGDQTMIWGRGKRDFTECVKNAKFLVNAAQGVNPRVTWAPFFVREMEA